MIDIIKNGFRLFNRRTAILVSLIVIISTLTGFLDIFLAYTVSENMKDTGKSNFLLPVMIFLFRLIFSFLLVFLSSYTLKILMTHFLGVTSRKLYIVKSENLESDLSAGLHNITHDVPHFINLFYAPFVTLLVEVVVSLPLVVYFFLKSHIYFKLVFGFSFLLIVIYTYYSKKNLNFHSLRVIKLTESISENLQILLKQVKEYYFSDRLMLIDRYTDSMFKNYSKSFSAMNFFAGVQKPIVEIVLFISFVLVYIIMGLSSDVFNNEWPLLLILVLRIGPSVGRILAALANIRLSRSGLSRLSLLLDYSNNIVVSDDIPILSNKSFKSNFSVTLNDQSEWVINLHHNKGILVVKGDSGVGKTQFIESLFSHRDNSPLNNAAQAILFRDDRIAFVPQFPEHRRSMVEQYFENFGIKVDESQILKRILIKDGLSTLNIHFNSIDSGGDIHSRLSGGENYYISLYRALYSKATIIFLDEPFASLDNYISEIFFKDLVELSKNKFFIIISHQEIPVQFKNVSINYLRINKL